MSQPLAEVVTTFNWKLLLRLILLANIAYFEGMFWTEGLFFPGAWVFHLWVAYLMLRWCGWVYPFKG